MARQGAVRHGLARQGVRMGPYGHHNGESEMTNFRFKGEPTRPLVEKLMLLNTSEGSSADHGTVANIIGVRPGTTRFRTVTSVWRRRLLKERSIQTLSQGGAFVFLTHDQADDKCRKGVDGLVRGTRRLNRNLRYVDMSKLSTDERKASHVLLRREAAALEAAVAQTAKSIALPAPITARPALKVVG